MKYVIVGNGAAAINALLTIRQYSSDPIVLISKEKCPAYSPLLIPYYISGQLHYEDMFLCDYAFYEGNAVETRFGSAAVILHPDDKLIRLEDGSVISYDRLLIATGSGPILPPIPGSNPSEVYTVWTPLDARRIKNALNRARRVVIVGAGPIGMRMMEILHLMRKQVTIIVRGQRVIRTILNPTVSEILQDRMKKEGICFLPGTKVASIEETPKGKVLYLDSGTVLEADMVIMAAGAAPNTDIAKGSGIKVGQGIVVDEHCRTNVLDIYAAGDVAEMISPVTGGSEINPTWINAVFQGRTAGANMAGVTTSHPLRARVNVFNVLGLPVVSIGPVPQEGDDYRTLINRGNSYNYECLYFDGERLASAVLIGNVGKTGILVQMIERGVPCSCVSTDARHKLFSIQAWLCSFMISELRTLPDTSNIG